MHHFAIFSPPFPSHVNALEALAIELLNRGHQVTWLHMADVREAIHDPRIAFHCVGTESHPPGTLRGLLARAAQPGNLRGLRRVIQDMSDSTDMLCRDVAQHLSVLGIDAVIADQMEAAGGLLAAGAKLPWISVACALPINREPQLPLPVMPWVFGEDDASLHRNRVSARVYDWLMAPLGKVISQHAGALGLSPRSTLEECLSPTLQLSQTVEAFDFPRHATPSSFFHVGPLRPPVATQELDLPVSSDRPFIFASLGTMQGGRFGLFLRIAKACRQLNAQLLVAHCGGLNAAQAAAVQDAGAMWVVDFAPQHAVLQRADVVVTHAGLNTVMDALATSTPMLLLPIAFDQPGVAARVVRSGAGVKLAHRFAGPAALARTLKMLLAEPRFRERAATLGRDVTASGGCRQAAELIERAVQTVLSDAPVLDADLILVGGGLANGLIARRLALEHPELRVLVLEAGKTLGGNHTWSFHSADLDARQREWLVPLLCYRWPAHEVRFPGWHRRIPGEYASITSDRFHAVLSKELGARVRLGQSVSEVGSTHVVLESGQRLRARAVIDGRGPVASAHVAVGFQKFIGHEVQTTRPHGILLPILMDAAVPQDGGYRFTYVLPLEADVLLIEDTCYADSAEIDATQLTFRIDAYAKSHGWDIARTLRMEQGVLPISLGGDVRAFWDDAKGVPRSGLAAGLFHPTTGYSLPEALALADRIASLPNLATPALFESIREHALERWEDQRFFRLLNRMLFRAGEPAQRWRVMARFYRLPSPLISRFYAGRLRWRDKLRIVTGKPPVPFFAACRAALDTPKARLRETTRAEQT